MKELFNDIYKMIICNFKTLLKFEIFKIFSGLMIVAISTNGLNIAVKLTKLSYFASNIEKVLLNSLTIIVILIIVFFFAVAALTGVTTLIAIFYKSYTNEKIGLINSIKTVFDKYKNTFKDKNSFASFILLFLFIFLNMSFVLNFVISTKIPRFIMHYISSNYMLYLLNLLIYFILLKLLFIFLFPLHYMVNEDNYPKKSMSDSKKTIHTTKFEIIIKTILFKIIICIFYIIFLFLCILIFYVFSAILTKLFNTKSIYIMLVCFLELVILLIFSIISNGISCALIRRMFYKYKKNNNVEKVHIECKKNKHDKNYINILKHGIFVFIVLNGVIFAHCILHNNFLDKKIEITAHRGASSSYPENTMSAFKGAVEFGADWIELDVQLTKDDKIVVSHDTNLIRVAGVNKNIIDMTYDEIKEIDVGSFFSEKFKGEKIPLLSDVIEFAIENNIRLNIELKPTGKEIEFEKKVIDLINQYSFKDKCVIASQIYTVLENSKKYDKTIKTVYVINDTIENINDVKYSDDISMESNYINIEQVKKIHASNKKIYAWTVNTKKKISQMVLLNVDNIITDDVKLTEKIVNKDDCLISKVLYEILELFMKN